MKITHYMAYTVTHVPGMDPYEMARPEGLEPPTTWFEASIAKDPLGPVNQYIK